MKVRIRHLKFIEEYISNGGDGKHAYMKVYPNSSPATAASNSCKILKMPEIQEELEKRKQEMKKDYTVEKDKLIQDLMLIKDTQMNTAPSTAIKAIELLVKIMGYSAPTKTEQDITVRGEQPLFGPTITDMEFDMDE